jgi:hypothetical protein
MEMGLSNAVAGVYYYSCCIACLFQKEEVAITNMSCLLVESPANVSKLSDQRRQTIATDSTVRMHVYIMIRTG